MFNDKFYRQTFGLPMGSPLSSILTDLVVQDLELVSLNKFSVTPLFYVRYVDDIALAIDNAHIDEILIKFNSYYPRRQFTMDIGGDSLNFLDICLMRKDETLTFN